MSQNPTIRMSKGYYDYSGVICQFVTVTIKYSTVNVESVPLCGEPGQNEAFVVSNAVAKMMSFCSTIIRCLKVGQPGVRGGKRPSCDRGKEATCHSVAVLALQPA